MTANGYGVSFWHNENVLKIVMMVVHFDSSKNYSVVYFKSLNLMIHEFHLKAIKKKKKNMATKGNNNIFLTRSESVFEEWEKSIFFL